MGTKAGLFKCPKCEQMTVRLRRETRPIYKDVEALDGDGKATIRVHSGTTVLGPYKASCDNVDCDWRADNVTEQDRGTRKEILAADDTTVYNLGLVDKTPSKPTVVEKMDDDRYYHSEPSYIPGYVVRKRGAQAEYEQRLARNISGWR